MTAATNAGSVSQAGYQLVPSETWGPLSFSILLQTKPGFRLSIDGSYIDKVTGRTWILAGLRSKRRVCLIHDADGPDREVRDYTPADGLEHDYDFAGCDHVNYCCSAHRIHISPHLGCMFR